jgi:hypothetical protein
VLRAQICVGLSAARPDRRAPPAAVRPGVLASLPALALPGGCDLTWGETETDADVMEIRPVPAEVSRTRVPAELEPRAAAQYPASA